MTLSREPFHVDLAAAPVDSLPVIEPAAVVVSDPAYAGAWTVAGDLDGDGLAELVQARLWESNDTHAVAAVAACRLDGTRLWQWGDPATGVAALHSDAPCQIHDWDRDGRPEVVIATRTDLIVLDGATGEELRRFATPGPDAADCIVFARLSGNERDDVLLKTRYHHIWAYTWDGRLLWHVLDPAGMLTAHQPYPVDLDGDGLDEILAGYALLDQDGQPLWTLDAASLHLGKGHLDCARVLRRGATPQQWRLALTCCGDNALLCLDGTGRLIWEHRGMHFESIAIGRMDSTSRQERILVDIDHRAHGLGPLHVYSQDGELLGEINSVYSRHHPLLAWGDDPLDRIVACEDRLLVCGATGQPLARLATPVPDGVHFDQAESPPEHRQRGPFHLLGHTGNLFGRGRQDLLLTTNPGGVAWIYRNPGQPGEGSPIGTSRNVTLY